MMAPPHGETMVSSSYSRPSKNLSKPPRLSNDNLKRTISDIAYELSKGIEDEIIITNKDNNNNNNNNNSAKTLPPICEAQDAKCECCGMSEEYTEEYIQRVRDKYSGKWICGLCSEAVNGEMDKNGGKVEEALEAHMSHCVRFNKLGRAYPVLCQAEAMREILKKSSRVRGKSMSPRDLKGPKGGGITRSSSCIPAITRDMNDILKLRN